MVDEEDTDPKGGGPVSEPTIPSIQQLAGAVLEAMHEEFKKLRQEMEHHQVEEIAHHKRVDASIKLLVKYYRNQNKQLGLLEARLAELEGKEPAA